MKTLFPTVIASILLVACNREPTPPAAGTETPVPASAPAPAPDAPAGDAALDAWTTEVQAKLAAFSTRFDELKPVIKLNLDEGLNKVAQVVDRNTTVIRERLDELPGADAERIEAIRKEVDILAETVDNMLDRGARMAAELTRPEVPETPTSLPPN